MRVPPAPAFWSDNPGLPVLLARHEGLARAEQDGRYQHWEELRHRPPPVGVTHEQWWQLVKLARKALANELPLTDLADRKFTFAITDTVFRISFGIEHELRGTAHLPPGLRDAASRKRYELSSLLEEALRSSQLEGATTTRVVAKELIRTRRAPRNNSERMVLGNYHAMEWVREHHAERLTPASILELHSIVMDGILSREEGAGRLRREDEKIEVVDNSDGEVLHTPPPAATLSVRMAEMCKFANGEGDTGPFLAPVLRSILVHFWLAYDHPFIDGNGRTARALFYWSMLRQGYQLAEFISISRAIQNARSQYEKAFLFSETDTNDTTYFLINQLKMIRASLNELYAYVEEKSKQVAVLEVSLRARAAFNDRQLDVLNHALRHPEARFTVEEHQTSHAIAYETARTDLTSLADKGYLVRSKTGKKLYFLAPPDLEKKITG